MFTRERSDGGLGAIEVPQSRMPAEKPAIVLRLNAQHVSMKVYPTSKPALKALCCTSATACLFFLQQRRDFEHEVMFLELRAS